MCRLRNIAMRDYQESVTTGQTDTGTDRQRPHKVIPMCRYASQALQKIVTAFQEMHVSPVKHIAMHDYQESVTTGQTDRHMDRHCTK